MDFVDPSPTPDHSVHRSDQRLVRTYADWIVAVTLAVLGLTLLFTELQSPSYTSTARVVVQPRVFPNANPPQPPDMGTEQAVASSSVVTSMAAVTLRVPVSDLTKGLHVSVATDTHVLSIASSQSSPAVAQRRAGAVAEAYIQYLRQQGIRQKDGVSLRPPPEGLEQAAVISPATLPSSPTSPSYGLNLTIGAVLGLALGIAAAAARDRVGTRLRGAGDLAQHSGMPVLGAIPPFGRRLGTRVVSTHPESEAAEAYRYLRAKVRQTLLPNGRGTLLVTSAAPGDGRTTTAVNLAEAFAAAGARVVLVEGDLRGDGMAATLGMAPASTGLTTVLTESVPVEAALQLTDVSGVRVLLRGPHAPAPGDLLAGSSLPRLMAGLLELSDILIVDAPPILSAADTVALLRVSDAALLVVDSRRTTRRLIEDAAHEIRWAGGLALAATVNTVPRRARWARRALPRIRPLATGGRPRSARRSGAPAGQ